MLMTFVIIGICTAIVLISARILSGWLLQKPAHQALWQAVDSSFGFVFRLSLIVLAGCILWLAATKFGK